MNLIFLALVPLAIVLFTTPVLRGLQNTLTVALREKRWVSPVIPYDRHNSTPFVALVFALSVVLAMIVPVVQINTPLYPEANIFTIVGVILLIMFAVKVYNVQSKIPVALGCIAFALISLSFSAGYTNLTESSLMFSGLSENLLLSTTIIGSILFAILLFYNPNIDSSTALQDTLWWQRVLWALFLGNLLWPFYGLEADSFTLVIAVIVLLG